MFNLRRVSTNNAGDKFFGLMCLQCHMGTHTMLYNVDNMTIVIICGTCKKEAVLTLKQLATLQSMAHAEIDKEKLKLIVPAHDIKVVKIGRAHV